MRRAGRVVAEMHEAVHLAAKPGATTADLDAAGARGARAARGPLELPRLQRLPGRGLHLAQRGDRPRHPRRPGDRRRRHRVDRLRGDHRGLARRRRDHDPGRGGRRGVAPAARVHQGRRSTPRSRCARRAPGSATSAPRSRASPTAAATRWCASTSATASAPPCTRTPRSPTTAPPGRGLRLREGMVLAIEPMLNIGRRTTRLLDDGWTVVTADGSRSAHFEHSVAITEHGPEILTLPIRRDPRPGPVEARPRPPHAVLWCFGAFSGILTGRPNARSARPRSSPRFRGLRPPKRTGPDSVLR